MGKRGTPKGTAILARKSKMRDGDNLTSLVGDDISKEEYRYWEKQFRDGGAPLRGAEIAHVRMAINRREDEQ